jgi:hypothetical protein
VSLCAYDIQVVVRFSLREDDPKYDEGSDNTIMELRGSGMDAALAGGWTQEEIRRLYGAFARPVLDAIGERPVAKNKKILDEEDYAHFKAEDLLRIGGISADVLAISERWVDIDHG